MSPYPSLNKAYSMLQHDEHQKENSSDIPNFSNDSTSFYTSVAPGSTNRFVSQKVQFDSKRQPSTVSCKYCKKPRHTIDKCYKLCGFPLDFKFTKSRKGSATYVQRTESSIDSGHPGSTSHGFTKEQYQHLMSLLQNAHVAPAPVFLSPLRVLLVIKLLLPVLQVYLNLFLILLSFMNVLFYN